MVSVIIPNYNGSKFIEVCIDSLLKQTYSNFEIIVVDNASQDNSCKLIKEKYHQIKVIELEKNYGFSKAVNIGIRSANSKYVVLLNNDTELDKCWLAELISLMENDYKIFSCCSKMLMYDRRNIIDDAGDFYTILGWTIKRGLGQNNKYHTKSSKVFSSCGGAAIYRKELFDKIGYFDENFFAYLEDVDVSYRANINGYKNWYCSRAIVYHIGSATSGSKYNKFKVRFSARNNVYVIHKNMPMAQIVLNLPFLFLGNLIKTLFFTLKGYGNDYVEGLIDGIKTLKKIKKVKYVNENFINYVRIELEMFINLFLLFSKIN